jgi:hypothetical protein
MLRLAAAAAAAAAAVGANAIVSFTLSRFFRRRARMVLREGFSVMRKAPGASVRVAVRARRAFAVALTASLPPGVVPVRRSLPRRSVFARTRMFATI